MNKSIYLWSLGLIFSHDVVLSLIELGLCLILQVIKSILDFTSVYFNIVLQKFIVDVDSSLSLGVHHVDKEQQLQEEVEGDQREDETSELIHNLESSKDDPIRQPLLVIINCFGL